jgi:hypothetical protein
MEDASFAEKNVHGRFAGAKWPHRPIININGYSAKASEDV